MWNEGRDQLKSVFWSKLVAIDIRKGKKTPIPKEYYLLEDIVVPVDVSKGFDRRLEEIFAHLKANSNGKFTG